MQPRLNRRKDETEYGFFSRILDAGGDFNYAKKRMQLTLQQAVGMWNQWAKTSGKRIPAAQPQPTQAHTRRMLPRSKPSSVRGKSGNAKGERQRLPALAPRVTDPQALFDFGGMEVTVRGPVKVTLASGDAFFISTVPPAPVKGK